MGVEEKGVIQNKELLLLQKVCSLQVILMFIKVFIRISK